MMLFEMINEILQDGFMTLNTTFVSWIATNIVKMSKYKYNRSLGITGVFNIFQYTLKAIH